MELITTISVGTSSKSAYIPVPKAGRVRNVRASWNQAVASDDTIALSKGANTVNTLTVGADNTAAGGVVQGVPDSDNMNLSFDPNGDSAEDKAIKVDISALESANTLITLVIDYDEFGIPVRD